MLKISPKKLYLKGLYTVVSLSGLMFLQLLMAGEVQPAWGAGYYFSSLDGDDSRNSVSAKNHDTPWKSIKKLNEIAGNLQPGDTIFFKRNEVFYGSIHLRASGTQEKPLVISAFGEGADPVISGWSVLEDWVSSGKGVYHVPFLADKTNMLVIDEQPQEMGRSPNKGFLTYLKDNEENTLVIDGEAPAFDLSRSQLVIRKNQWIIDKHSVESVNGKTVKYSGNSKYKLTNDYGFFFQDHLQTLDSYGEWFHDVFNHKFYLYFGDSTPARYNVRASSVDYLVTNAPKVRHVVLENLCFSGANLAGIFLKEASNIALKSCTIQLSGGNGISAVAVPFLTIESCSIENVHNNGVFLRYGTPNAIIRQNKISRVHLFYGMGSDGDGNGIGIYSLSDNTLIEKNWLEEIGYSGIVFNGESTKVQNNYISNFCLVKNDGGGIYTFEGGRNRSMLDRSIKENIIVNGVGSMEGTGMFSKHSKPQVEGIYLDDNASGIEVTKNTVGNVKRNAINLHNARDIVIKRNTFFNAKNQLSMSHDKLGDPIRDVVIESNNFIMTSLSQRLVALSSVKDDFSKMASFKDNRYVFPENSQSVFEVKQKYSSDKVVTKSFSLQQWENGPIEDVLIDVVELPESSYNIERERTNVLIYGKASKLDPGKIGCLDDGCTLSVEGDDGGIQRLKVKTQSPHSGLKISIGSVDPSKQYLMRLTVETTHNLTAHLVLRHKGRPWSNVSETGVLGLDPTSNIMTCLFSFPDKSDEAVLLLTLEDEKGSFVIHKIEWIEANISMRGPELVFKFNPSFSPKRFKLSGVYSDLSGNVLKDEVLVEPFSSEILYRRD